MKLWSPTIGGKLKAIIMAACILVLLIASGIYVVNDLYRLRGDIVEKLATLSRVVAANCIAAMVFDDPGAAEEMLSAFSGDPRVVTADILTRKGDLFAEYVNSNRTIESSGIAMDRVRTRSPSDRLSYVDSTTVDFQGKHIRLVQPAFLTGEVIGWIRVWYSLDEYEIRIKRHFGIALAVLFLSVGIAYVLATRLHRIISEPIISLAQHMKLVSERKDYSLTKTSTSEDEIGRLIEGYNTMLGEVKTRDDELLAAKNRLTELLVSSPAVIYSMNIEELFTLTYVSENVRALLGFPSEELLGQKAFWLDHIHPEDREKALLELGRLGDRSRVTLEFRFRGEDGSWMWLYTEAQVRGNKEPGAEEAIGYIINITDRKELEGQLHRNAFYDSLTGLPNRALLLDRLGVCLREATRDQARGFGLMFLDLDRFKDINDSFGHATGDALLVQITQRLEWCVRPGDTVARLGGDEFGILLVNVVELGAIRNIADRILAELARPFTLQDRIVYTGASIGITTSSARYDSPEQMIRDADNAMYRAKAREKGSCVVFDQSMHVETLERLELENELRRGIEQEDLELYFQPIVDLGSGRVAGFESLVRWHHYERGIVLPDEFIPLAEEVGLIEKIGTWVAWEACRHLSRWQREFPSVRPLHMSVNISAMQLGEHFITSLMECLKKNPVEPNSLMLEITESVVMEKARVVSDLLWKIKAMDVRLCIDDFGTGYSSLSYLHRFPFDVLKIDRSFVLNPGAPEEHVEVIRTILALGANMKMDVIIEGIEGERQAAVARELGCRLAQGFYFYKPLPRAETEQLLRSSSS